MNRSAFQSLYRSLVTANSPKQLAKEIVEGITGLDDDILDCGIVLYETDLGPAELFTTAPVEFTTAWSDRLYKNDFTFHRILESRCDYATAMPLLKNTKIDEYKRFYDEASKIRPAGDSIYLPIRLYDQICGFSAVQMVPGTTVSKQKWLRELIFLFSLLNPALERCLSFTLYIHDSPCGLFHEQKGIMLFDGKGQLLEANSKGEHFMKEFILHERAGSIETSSTKNSFLFKKHLQNFLSNPLESLRPTIIDDGKGRPFFASFQFLPNYEIRRRINRCPTVAALLSRTAPNHAFSLDIFSKNNHLTKREREVVQCLFAGSSNREISSQLFISEETVKRHLYNIYEKTGCRTRVQLTSLFFSSSSR